MNKKIIILGAGIYQTPLIKKAKELGLYTIVISIEGNYPGFEFADKIYYIDTTDKESVLKVAVSEKIDAICTTGTDVAIVTIGYVCEKLNLTGISELSGVLSTDKLPMKNAFEEFGVRTAKYRKVISKEESYKVFKELTPPLMFKATDTSGSRGVIKVENYNEIDDAFEYAYSITSKSYILIEEFIDGVEFGAQSVVCNGEIKFILPHGDILYHGKTDVPIGHYVPYNLPSDEIKKDIANQINLTIKALKLDNCALNFDFILSNNKIYVLEVGARVGATCLAEQVGNHYNINYYEYIILMSLGSVPDVDFSVSKSNASLLFISHYDGIFNNLDLDIKKYDIVEKVIDYNKGDKIKKFEVGPDRIGHIIIEYNTELDILTTLDQLQKDYKVIIDN